MLCEIPARRHDVPVSIDQPFTTDFTFQLSSPSASSIPLAYIAHGFTFTILSTDPYAVPGGSGTLANGAASYKASAWLSGDVVVSAQYSGDASFTQSVSPPILVLSVVPANTSMTVATDVSVVNQVNLTSAPGYTGTIQLSCSGLPQNASCSFQPASFAFTGSTSSSSASLTIQTGVSSQAALQHRHPSFPGKQRAAQAQSGHSRG
jgi:hypothetical protein